MLKAMQTLLAVIIVSMVVVIAVVIAYYAIAGLHAASRVEVAPPLDMITIESVTNDRLVVYNSYGKTVKATLIIHATNGTAHGYAIETVYLTPGENIIYLTGLLNNTYPKLTGTVSIVYDDSYLMIGNAKIKLSTRYQQAWRYGTSLITLQVIGVGRTENGGRVLIVHYNGQHASVTLSTDNVFYYERSYLPVYTTTKTTYLRVGSTARFYDENCVPYSYQTICYVPDPTNTSKSSPSPCCECCEQCCAPLCIVEDAGDVGKATFTCAGTTPTTGNATFIVTGTGSATLKIGEIVAPYLDTSSMIVNSIVASFQLYGSSEYGYVTLPSESCSYTYTTVTCSGWCSPTSTACYGGTCDEVTVHGDVPKGGCETVGTTPYYGCSSGDYCVKIIPLGHAENGNGILIVNSTVASNGTITVNVTVFKLLIMDTDESKDDNQKLENTIHLAFNDSISVVLPGLTGSISILQDDQLSNIGATVEVRKVDDNMEYFVTNETVYLSDVINNLDEYAWNTPSDWDIKIEGASIGVPIAHKLERGEGKTYVFSTSSPITVPIQVTMGQIDVGSNDIETTYYVVVRYSVTFTVTPSVDVSITSKVVETAQ